MERQHKDVIFRRLYDTLSAVVQGMMATALVQGVLCGVAFWALDVPFSLLLGFAAALASFVPFFGAGLVWLPCVAYLMVMGLWVRSVVLLAWGSLAVSTVDNLLRPMIIGDRTKIPTIFLFFGILGGVQAYGVIGVFLGPALIGMLIAVLRIYRDEYAAGRA
jgi:predicted PurR-regulated permease PerM